MSSFDDDAKARSTALKDEGNVFFEAHKFNHAIEKYSEAIAIYPTAVLHSNKAQALIKIEAYGLAIIEAEKAMELDPTYVKAYYRRATANFALGEVERARDDYKAVLQTHPLEADAQKKLTACERAIKEETIRRNIQAASPTPASLPTSILNHMKIENNYHGPKLQDDDGNFLITPELVIEMMTFFKEQKLLPKKYLCMLLFAARDYFSQQPTLMNIMLPRGGSGDAENENDETVGEITICGDTHGQFYDLCTIFDINGWPSDSNPYIFNGDFVDRGSFSVEVVTTLLAWKLACPRGLFMTRGNHETINMNRMYGFEGEVQHKYDKIVMNLFTEVFNWLPLAAVVEKKIFVVHGGISCENEGRIPLDNIVTIRRNREPSQGLMSDLLWADPHPGTGKMVSSRGTGFNFGSDHTKNFLKQNGLMYLVRSHELQEEGYSRTHDGKCITIFSAPNYCDQMGNKGAFLKVGKDMELKFTQFSAVPHPNVPPMRYVSNFFGL